MDVTITIPDALAAELQRQVAQANRTKVAGLPDVTVSDVVLARIVPWLEKEIRESSSLLADQLIPYYLSVPADKQAASLRELGVQIVDGAIVPLPKETP